MYLIPCTYSPMKLKSIKKHQCFFFYFWLMVAGDGLGGPGEEEEEDDSPQLLRTRSDASFMHIQRRTKTHSAHDLQRLRTHRFSINGHFYNHKVPENRTYGDLTRC